jgi:uncharacterized protein with HEPN domain
MSESTIKSVVQSDRAPPRAFENRRIVIAATLFALLLIGEAALFIHAARTIPDFLINYFEVP